MKVLVILLLAGFFIGCESEEPKKQAPAPEYGDGWYYINDSTIASFRFVKTDTTWHIYRAPVYRDGYDPIRDSPMTHQQFRQYEDSATQYWTEQVRRSREK